MDEEENNKEEMGGRSRSITVGSRGGGGGVLRFGSNGGCAAEAAKPIPIFKGHFGGKGYLLLRVFSQENDVFVYFSDEMGEITKVGGMFRDFQLKTIPYV